MTTLCHFSHRRGAHKSNPNRNHHALLWISDTVSFNKICKYFAVNWFPSFILLSPYLLFMTPPPLLEAQRWGWGGSRRQSFLAFLQLVLAQCYTSGNKGYLWKLSLVPEEMKDSRQECFHWLYSTPWLSWTTPHVLAKENDGSLIWSFFGFPCVYRI